MKFRRTNKVGKFEVKKIKNKGAVSKKCRSCRDLSTLPLSPWAKIKKSDATFLARSTLNKCAKFHEDSPSG